MDVGLCFRLLRHGDHSLPAVLDAASGGHPLGGREGEGVSSCELPEFYSEDFPKAAKEHRCCECRAPIDRGEVHLYARMKFDGEFDTYRQHSLCRELCMAMNFETDWECCPFGGMKDSFDEGNFREDADMSHLMAFVMARELAGDADEGRRG